MGRTVSRRALFAGLVAGAVGLAVSRDSTVGRLCSRPAATPKRSDVSWEPHGDGLVLRTDGADPLSAEYRLNPVGAMVWLYSDGNHSFGDIASRVSSTWGVPRARAAVDTARFLKDLQQQGLVSMS